MADSDEKLYTSFRGGPTGFVKGHYPIWYNGLPAEYREQGGKETIINWYARRAGVNTRSQLKHPGKAAQSSAQRFITYFKEIIENEREKEIGIIKTYLNNLKSNSLKFETLDLAEEALNNGSLSTAYTWIMKFQLQIKELKQEVQAPKNGNFQNISHMNDFWNKELSTFIEKLFDSPDRDTKDNYTVKYENATVEDLVQAYINQVMSQGQDQMIHNMDSIYQEMVKKFKNLLIQADIRPESTNLFSKANFKRLVKAAENQRKEKKLKPKVTNTTKQKISVIADYIGYEVGRGMGQELNITAKASHHGETFHVGNMLKTLPITRKVVKTKADVWSIVVDEGTIDLSSISQPLAKIASSKSWEDFEQYRLEIDRIAQAADTEIFDVMYNVKGYQSRRDMFIAQGGTFESRTQQLRVIADTGVIPNNMFDKFIFLLYNTAKGCILDGETDFLKLYLGVACAVWYFDDYLDINVYSKGMKKGLNTVHIFTSGGNFYTLSEILQVNIDQLEEYVLQATTGETLFTIDIAPPKFNAAEEYQNIVDTNRDAMNAAIEDEDENGIQMLLQERWDAMSSLVGTNGFLRVRVKQNKLEELLSMFEAYLRS